MKLGVIIKSVRKEKGLKIKDLAELSKTKSSYISMIENRNTNPTLETLERIALALKIPLPIIFFMALEEKDIKLEKVDAFRLIQPSLNTFLTRFFN